mgnify:CR=1 FL=1
MNQKDYYSVLWISKDASISDIKKAYKKKAMEFHPDRNKDNKNAEKKFKEINEAYQTLWDEKKRKSYDQFGNTDTMGGNYWNPFSGGWFEDIFSQFGWNGWWRKQNSEFDFSDLFGNNNHKEKAKQESNIPSLDIIETVEIPFLDFLFDTSISIKTVYGKNLSLKVKSGTKPGTKFKISWKGRTNNGVTWDMYIIVNAKMPKEITEWVKSMLEAIRYQL